MQKIPLLNGGIIRLRRCYCFVEGNPIYIGTATTLYCRREKILIISYEIDRLQLVAVLVVISITIWFRHKPPKIKRLDILILWCNPIFDAFHDRRGTVPLFGNLVLDAFYGHRGKVPLFGNPTLDAFYDHRGTVPLFGNPILDSFYDYRDTVPLFGNPILDAFYGHRGTVPLFGNPILDAFYDHRGTVPLFGNPTLNAFYDHRGEHGRCIYCM